MIFNMLTAFLEQNAILSQSTLLKLIYILV
jgi:hypothetical protein